ncbi:outer capsid protein Hoc [Streptomyces sp. 3MP-14]|uniref:Outer capsid protein Hoc n=1 Tax=Streptomyces mimosae TaxID=2586635 RepID=A0A5N6AGU2_9ACTN|nr:MULTISPECIES: phage tail tube protein [Streptomyces]KAB8167060.1 outer capsid protein Hoc [Streptomyces mimosae]KAB8177001.1 outer capsid protein Hoc [Streptomyces sp. 3MP-14]
MAGINGFGTAFQHTVAGEFVTVAESTSISGPGLSKEALDATTHQSPDAHMEFVGGLVDPGEVSVDIRYDPALHDALVAHMAVDQPEPYRIVWPDALNTSWTFDAIMTGFEPEGPYDDLLTASLTFKVSGKPSIGPLEDEE